MPVNIDALIATKPVPRFAVWLGKVTGVAFAYYVAACFAQLQVVPPGYASLFWPPAGVAFAALWLFGYGLWPGIFLGYLAYDMVYDIPFFGNFQVNQALMVLAVGIPSAAGASLQAIAATAIARRVVKADQLWDVKHLAKLLVVAGPLCCVISASFGPTARAVMGLLPWSAYAETWRNWWFGDAAGVVVVTPLALVLFSGRHKPKLARTSGILGVIGTVGLWYGLARADTQSVSAHAEMGARERARAIEKNLGAVLEDVQSLVALFHASTLVDADEFKTFTKPSISRHGINAMGWLPRVIGPKGGENYLVAYTEPGGVVLPLDGRDMGEAVKQAMSAARHTGEVALSGRIDVPTDDPDQAVVLAVGPVFSKDRPANEAERRGEELAGFAVAVIDIDELVSGSLAQFEYGGSDFLVVDEAADPDGGPLHVHKSRARTGSIAREKLVELILGAPAETTYVSRISLGGRYWRVVARPTDEALWESRSALPLVVLIGGLAISVLLGNYLAILDERTRHVEELVNERTLELDERNRSLQTALEQLDHARTDAEAANRAKSDFLANMSHEIRTPMTAILGYADLLQDPDESPEVRTEWVRTIQRNGAHLLTVINDILDISKIEAGKLAVEQIECSVFEILEDVTSTMRGRAKEKGLGFGTVIDGPLPEVVRSDPTRLKQILVNLVGNAIKFTDSGGVTIRARMEPVGQNGRSTIAIEVADTGIGMEEGQQSALFKAFSQVDTSTTRKYGGTGLGLLISQRLAAMLGGGITVQSERGRGSTFTVTIDTGPLDGVRFVESELRSQAARGVAVKPDVQEEARLEGVRVLLAEDGPDNQRLIGSLLRAQGAKVDIAENGRVACKKALEALATDRAFNVILMDMQMPELSGREATAELRERGYGAPIIALTALTMGGDHENSTGTGCDCYTTKPIKKSELVELVARYANLNRTGPGRSVSGDGSGQDLVSDSRIEHL